MENNRLSSGWKKQKKLKTGLTPKFEGFSKPKTEYVNKETFKDQRTGRRGALKEK